ncbi:FtsX-like permease family protein [Mycetocola saprophilus]|uniref:FtsX-like permease family protein n=1 Tax=Mycetocola saprophilus TaxID=76636 RepID=UPI003BF2E7CC
MRILGIAAGIGIGVMLLLLLWGGYRALDARSERWDSYSRFEPYVNQNSAAIVPGSGQTLVMGSTDGFREQDIQRIDVSSPDARPALFETAVTLPRAGEYLASPALARLVAETAPAELGVRFGSPAGILPDSVLPTPDSLVAVVVHTEPEMLGNYNARVLPELDPSGAGFGGIPVYGFVAILGVLAVAAPVLLLIAIVADLGQVARRERTAQLRLLGAGRGVIAHLAALEMIPAAVLGVLMGALGAWLTVPLFSRIPVLDGTFFASDLRVPAGQQIVVLALVAAFVPLVAAIRARRGDRGALPGSVLVPETVPSAWRILPLGVGVLGIPALIVLVDVLHGMIYWVAALIVLILVCVGLVIAGPYLTLLLGRALLGGAKSAPRVIALGRTVRLPRAAFRAVSGLVIALFLVSMFQIAMTANVDEFAQVEHVGTREVGFTRMVALENSTGRADLPERRREALENITGVEYAVNVYRQVGGEGQILVSAEDARSLGLTPAAGESVVAISSTITSGFAPELMGERVDPETERLNIATVALTDGTPEAIECARSAVWAQDVAVDTVPVVLAERRSADGLSYFGRFSTLASIGAAVAGGISMLALAVATIIGVADRRMVFTRLRLIGVRASTLRRVILAENLIPLAAMSALAVGLGLLAGWVVIRVFSGGNRQVGWPGAEYLITLALLVFFAAVALGLAMLSVRGATSGARLREE